MWEVLTYLARTCQKTMAVPAVWVATGQYMDIAEEIESVVFNREELV